MESEDINFDLGIHVSRNEIIEMAQGWLGDVPLETTEIAWDQLGSDPAEIPETLAEAFRAVTVTILAASVSGIIFFPDNLEARDRWITKKVIDVVISWMGGAGGFGEIDEVVDKEVEAGAGVNEVIQARMAVLEEELLRDGSTPLFVVSLGHDVFKNQIDVRTAIDLNPLEIVNIFMSLIYYMALEQSDDTGS